MGDRPKAPKAPDPYQTASAQFNSHVGSNQFGALQSSGGYSGPGGSVSKSISYKTMKDPFSGKTINVPVQSTSYNLDDQGQQLHNQAGLFGIRAGENLNRYASGPDMHTQVFGPNAGDGGQAAIESKLTRLGSRTLEPRLEQQRRAMDDLNEARGITMGSDLGAEMDRRRSNADADARAALYTSAFGTAANTVANERAQRMQAMQGDRNFNRGLFGSSIAGRNQLAQGLFSMPNQNYSPGINPVNIGGYIQDNYRNKMEQYKTDRQHHYGFGNFMGDIAGTAGQAAGAYLGNPAAFS